MSGKSFEDTIWKELEDAVGQNGVVLLRRQAFRARAGHGFQADQVTGDLLVDSPDDSYYIGVECKTISGKYRFYFNGNYQPEQIKSQMEYQDYSGRDIFVAVEVRVPDDADEDDLQVDWDEDRAFLFPIELFAYFAQEEAKVAYEDMETFGYLLGKDGDYDLSGDTVAHSRAKKEEFQRRLDGLETDLSDFTDE